MNILSRCKGKAAQFYTNLRGWKTQRKLLVIESDDWGAIRMPGPKTYEQLLKVGIPVDSSPYDRLDCLENRDDFQALMNVIDAHRGASGRPAIFTFNTVMGNPRFDAIEAEDFRRFHHQHLFDSYQQYNGEDMEPDWRAAMESKLIQPQFHAREHLNVPLWMRDLQAGQTEARIAFNHNFYGLTTKTSSPRQVNYLAAYWTESNAELDAARERLRHGLSLFRQTFGFGSETFIPCNYVFPDELQPLMTEHGVRLIQGQRGQFVPDPNGGKGRIRRSPTGQKSGVGLRYSVRNVKFEPFEDESVDWVGRALKEIAQAFALKTPAIISSHRVNYVGGMSITHRDKCLGLLDQLLASIRSRWPEAEFISTDQLLSLMESR